MMHVLLQAKFSKLQTRLTRSKARSLNIDLKDIKLEPPKKKKNMNDDSNSNNAVSTSSGEAAKKRNVYKKLLGFNNSSCTTSSATQSTSCSSNQSNCTPSQELQPSCTTVSTIEFRIGEVVWAKIKGFPAWPAKIKAVASSKMVIVVWFNDYRITKVYKTQLFKFLENFDTNAKNFDNSIGLKVAAQEALMYYGSVLAGHNFYQNRMN